MSRDLKLRARILAAALAIPAADAALAQSAALEEIVVTAQRREQSLQDVGVSVTALGTQQIQDAGITSALDIGRVAPGIAFVSTVGGNSFASLSVRGVAQTDTSSQQEPPNAIYVDDVYISTLGATGFATYDLDRIEVLRGPQGTLFGRNSTGGLAHFVTAKPSEELQGYVEAGYGEFNQYWVEGAIGGPLSERVRARVSGRREKADGWWKNTAPGGKDSFETDVFGVRTQVEFDVTDELLARLTLGYDKRPRHRSGTYKTRNFYIDGTGQPAPLPEDLDAYGTGPGNNFVGYRDSFGFGPRSAFSDDGFFTNRLVSPTLLLQWKRDDLTFTSVTNYSDFKYGYYEDTDGTPFDFARANNRQDLTQWSQEFRLSGTSGPLLWTAGLYYLDIDTYVFTDFYFPLLSGSDFAFDGLQELRQKTQSWAPFAQLEWSLTDRLRLTAGLRYTHDKKTFDSQVYFRELGNGYSGGTGSTVFVPPLLVYDFNSATVGGLAKSVQGLWSGKLQLDYRPSEDALLYAGVSRGVKGAGFNSNLGAALTIEQTPFRDESVMAYEVGGKFDLLGRRLRLNASAYYYDYSDFQGYSFNGTQGAVDNYDGEFYGGELEIVASLPAGVRANAGASYMHTRLKDVSTAYSGIRDQHGVLAPEWVLNGGVQKATNLGPGVLTLLWSFDYMSDRYASVDNNAATHVVGSFVHNVRATYDWTDKGLIFAAFVDNLSDKNRQTFAYDLVSSLGGTINVFAKPRTWGVSVRKSF